MKRIALVLLLGVLTGCCTPCQEPVGPLVTRCPPPPADAFIRPELELQTLKPKDKPEDVVRAYVLSVMTLERHAKYLEKLLEGYR